MLWSSCLLCVLRFIVSITRWSSNYLTQIFLLLFSFVKSLHRFFCFISQILSRPHGKSFSHTTAVFSPARFVSLWSSFSPYSSFSYLFLIPTLLSHVVFFSHVSSFSFPPLPLVYVTVGYFPGGGGVMLQRARWIFLVFFSSFYFPVSWFLFLQVLFPSDLPSSLFFSLFVLSSSFPSLPCPLPARYKSCHLLI